MDTPLTLAQAINIAGFIQTLACWLLTERPFKHQPDDYLLYPFNRYQACRYGLEGSPMCAAASSAASRGDFTADPGSALRPSAECRQRAWRRWAPAKQETAKRSRCASLSPTAVRFRAGAKTLRDLGGIVGKGILRPILLSPPSIFLRIPERSHDFAPSAAAASAAASPRVASGNALTDPSLTLQSYTVDPQRERIAMYWKNRTAKPGVPCVRCWRISMDGRVQMAMNGGIYDKAYAPLGLYIEEGGRTFR
jgi:hypothetical protein